MVIQRTVEFFGGSLDICWVFLVVLQELGVGFFFWYPLGFLTVLQRFLVCLFVCFPPFWQSVGVFLVVLWTLVGFFWWFFKDS